LTQKAFFTKEAIVEAAFTVTREQGWAGVTARNIAKKLGSSTMPIYSSMKSMEEIEAKVKARAEQLLLDFQKRDYGGDAPMNMAMGYVTFARDERHLFHFLFDSQGARPAARGKDPGKPVPLDQMVAVGPVRLVDQVPTAMRDPRILKSWIFTHGLASMVSAGVLDLSNERIRSLLLESGAAFFSIEEEKEKQDG
jgi:AcrR family transcriptional regulator